MDHPSLNNGEVIALLKQHRKEGWGVRGGVRWRVEDSELERDEMS